MEDDAANCEPACDLPCACCHPPFGSVARFTELAVADLVSRYAAESSGAWEKS